MVNNTRKYWESNIRNAVKGTPFPSDFSTVTTALGLTTAQTQADLASVTTYLANRAIVATIPACRAAIAAHNKAAKLAMDQATTPAAMNSVYQANQAESNSLSDALQTAKIALVECNTLEQALLPTLHICELVNRLEAGLA